MELRNHQETECYANWSDHKSKLQFRKITEYVENKLEKGEAEGSTARRLSLSSRHGLGRGSDNGNDGHVPDVEIMDSLESPTNRIKLKPGKVGEIKADNEYIGVSAWSRSKVLTELGTNKGCWGWRGGKWWEMVIQTQIHIQTLACYQIHLRLQVNAFCKYKYFDLHWKLLTGLANKV